MEYSKETKKAFRQLILIARDRETAALMQAVQKMANAPYKESESTTDWFWQMEEWLYKKGKYLVDKYDCPNSVMDILVYRLYKEGHLRLDDEPMTNEVKDILTRLEAILSR